MKYRLFASSYTGGKPGDGIYALEFDGEQLRCRDVCAELVNPSYIQPDGDRLFAVEETENGAAMAIFETEKGLALQARYETPGSGMCHVTRCGACLYGSSYAGGSITGIRWENGELCSFRQHEGQGPNAQRQEGPHAHSAQPSPDGQHLFVADLGTDRLYQYDIASGGELFPHEAQPWIQVPPGRGPRHFAFHPNGRWLYLVAELENSLLVYSYEPHESVLRPAGEYSLRGGNCPPEALAADVHLTGTGDFLYASVRGSDRIFGFQVKGDGGELEPAGNWPSFGRGPRSFDLSPDGRFLAIANQDSGSLALCSRDAASGAVDRLVAELSLPQVCCVKWEPAAGA